MNHEDKEIAMQLRRLESDYLLRAGILTDDSSGRKLKLITVFGGQMEYFFLCEWMDTHEFFSAETNKIIPLIVQHWMDNE